MAVNSRDVVAAALTILDTYGFADLSMRRLGDQLGVQASAIYWHYPNKQSVLAAVADELMGEVPEPESVDPFEALREWAGSLRRVLLAHRDAAELVLATLAFGLAQRSPAAGGVAVLVGAGWPRDVALRTAQAIQYFILGHVYDEQSRQQLVRLGSSDTEPLDEAGFAHGVELLVAGARGASTSAFGPRSTGG